MKSRAPQLHLEYRFYRQLGTVGALNDGDKRMMRLLSSRGRSSSPLFWTVWEIQCPGGGTARTVA
jgi:hypothetical protein